MVKGVKWSFTVDLSDEATYDRRKLEHRIKSRVRQKSSELAKEIGRPSVPSTFRVEVTFHQKSGRWKKDNPQIPREDRGVDLDNCIKWIFDNLGPIIQDRIKWGKDMLTGRSVRSGKRGSADSKIVELIAKKINTGSDREYLDIVIESL